MLPTSLINYSNYLEQAEGLPVKNPYQLKTLEVADCLTKSREAAKVSTVAGCVSGAVCYALKLNPKTAVCAVVNCGISWCLTSWCACHCEKEAKKMIKHLKEI